MYWQSDNNHCQTYTVGTTTAHWYLIPGLQHSPENTRISGYCHRVWIKCEVVALTSPNDSCTKSYHTWCQIQEPSSRNQEWCNEQTETRVNSMWLGERCVQTLALHTKCPSLAYHMKPEYCHWSLYCQC